MARIAVVIANWDGRNHLERCLASLKQQTFRDFRIFLIDNGSSDDSIAFVQKTYPLVHIIPLRENRGFAFANNRGIEEASRDPMLEYVVTLNNDTTVDSCYLSELVMSADRHPKAASFQPKVLWSEDPTFLDCTGMLIAFEGSAVNRGRGERDVGQYENEEEIFGASASAALYRLSALRDARLSNGDVFDSAYFAYYEDVDLAFRLRLRGHSSVYVPRAKVNHVHSATGKSHSPFKSFYIHRNYYYTILKNLPLPELLLAFGFLPIRYLLLASSILRGKGASAHLYKNAGGHIIGIVFRSLYGVVLSRRSLFEKRRWIRSRVRVNHRDVRKWLRQYRAKLSTVIYGETSKA